MTAIYHITHLVNLLNIVHDGGLWCDRVMMERNLAHVSIAHQHIKDRRAQRRVPCAEHDTLADYVPFYFAPRSPMLYVINQGGVEGYIEGQRPIVHLVSSAEAVQSSGRSFVFTDGHADMDISRFFVNLGDLNRIDWTIMQARYWRDTNTDGDRKRRRQAEFLVHQFFPLKLIDKIGTYNLSATHQVQALFASSPHKPTIEPEPLWYY